MANLYRVPYVLRTAPDAGPQEKVLYVVATTPEEASDYVNTKPGHESKGANVQTPNVELAMADEDADAAREQKARSPKKK